jgi:hypothetical protein
LEPLRNVADIATATQFASAASMLRKAYYAAFSSALKIVEQDVVPDPVIRACKCKCATVIPSPDFLARRTAGGAGGGNTHQRCCLAGPADNTSRHPLPVEPASQGCKHADATLPVSQQHLCSDWRTTLVLNLRSLSPPCLLLLPPSPQTTCLPAVEHYDRLQAFRDELAGMPVAIQVPRRFNLCQRVTHNRQQLGKHLPRLCLAGSFLQPSTVHFCQSLSCRQQQPMSSTMSCQQNTFWRCWGPTASTAAACMSGRT